MSDRLRMLARSLLDQGPPPLDDQQRLWMRYLITDALDDLLCARSAQERVATAAAFYDTLGNAYLRLRGRWSGRGKWLPRLLRQADAGFGCRFIEAFDAIWQGGDCQLLAQVAQETLAPFGGRFAFREGHYQAAKPEWRRPLPGPSDTNVEGVKRPALLRRSGFSAQAGRKRVGLWPGVGLR